MNLFCEFVGNDGLRFKEYYPNNIKDIHPNKRGVGALARHYIYIIHSKKFNPLGY